MRQSQIITFKRPTAVRNPVFVPFYTPGETIDSDWDSPDEESVEVGRAFSMILRELDK